MAKVNKTNIHLYCRDFVSYLLYAGGPSRRELIETDHAMLDCVLMTTLAIRSDQGQFSNSESKCCFDSS